MSEGRSEPISAKSGRRGNGRKGIPEGPVMPRGLKGVVVALSFP